MKCFLILLAIAVAVFAAPSEGEQDEWTSFKVCLLSIMWALALGSNLDCLVVYEALRMQIQLARNVRKMKLIKLFQIAIEKFSNFYCFFFNRAVTEKSTIEPRNIVAGAIMPSTRPESIATTSATSMAAHLSAWASTSTPTWTLMSLLKRWMASSTAVCRK